MFAVKDIFKFVVVIMTAFEELSVSEDKKQKNTSKAAVLEFLHKKMGSSVLEVQRCNAWDNLKTKISQAQALPLQLLLVRRKEAKSSKISKVFSFSLCGT